MSQSFSFSFGGDDIEDTPDEPSVPFTHAPAVHAAETGTLGRPSTSNNTTAFPISGQALLLPILHSLESLIATLPSKIAYSTLTVILDNGEKLAIPRREWWDVRLQIMAEEEVNETGKNERKDGKDVDLVVLGKEDVKTGVYEGGFKSWESSVDLVKVLATRMAVTRESSMRVLEVRHISSYGFIFVIRPGTGLVLQCSQLTGSRWDAAPLFPASLSFNGV
jgi:protein-histidine N-methyltransferase